jgi:hypothetical protein
MSPSQAVVESRARMHKIVSAILPQMPDMSPVNLMMGSFIGVNGDLETQFQTFSIPASTIEGTFTTKP